MESDAAGKREENHEDDQDRDEQRKKAKTEAGERNEDSSDEEGETAENPVDDAQRHAFVQHLLAALAGRNRVGHNNAEMVQGMKEGGVFTDRRVEDALLTIPRGTFVPADQQDEAYIDSPLRLPTLLFNISAPHMYSTCLENLDIKPGHAVLDIGSGCGHFTVLSAYLAGKDGSAVGLDLRDDIIKFSEDNLKKIREETHLELSNVRFMVRNCFLPMPDDMTFDRIHVGACLPEGQAPKLLKLLRPNGIIVTPLGDRLVKLTAAPDGSMRTEKLMSVRYGDLIVPSEAEIAAAARELERDRARRIAVPPDTWRSDIAGLLNNRRLSDVTLIVEGKPIYCHRQILAARSQHFEAMFFDGLKESHEPEITLHDVSYDAFMGCLQHIYAGDTDLTDADRAIELLAPANYFKLDRLKALCEKKISENIETENAAYVLQIAARNEATQLRRFALDWILANFDGVQETKCFEDLDFALMKEVMKLAAHYANGK